MKFKSVALAAILAGVGPALAMAANRSIEEEIQLMKRNQKVKCELIETSIFEGERGSDIPTKHKVIFKGLKPSRSSDSEYATYALQADQGDYNFYYYMNSQVGEIRVKNKKLGIAAESSLDLSDMDKLERNVGAASLRHEKVARMKDSQTGREVEGRLITVATGTCALTK